MRGNTYDRVLTTKFTVNNIHNKLHEQQQQAFRGHHKGHPVLTCTTVKNWSILLEPSFYCPLAFADLRLWINVFHTTSLYGNSIHDKTIKVYAGRVVACCPCWVTVKYASRGLLRLAKRRDRKTDRLTDGLQAVTIRLLLEAASVKMAAEYYHKTWRRTSIGIVIKLRSLLMCVKNSMQQWYIA